MNTDEKSKELTIKSSPLEKIKSLFSKDKSNPKETDLNAKDIKKKVEKGISLKDKLLRKRKEKLHEKEQKEIDKEIETKLKKKKKKKKKNYRQFLEYYLPRAGYEKDLNYYKRILLLISIALTVVLFFGLIINSLIQIGLSFWYLALVLFIGVPLLFVIVFAGVILGFVIFIEMMIYKRKEQIEDVFPDFLQLAASNARSGMTIDRALWGAIRPAFGVLSKEMELVAKQTMSGIELDKALLEFSQKYDAPQVERSIKLLIEGVNAGGQIAEILDRIAMNLQNTKAMQKEMAANVTSYTMFILFATLVAAPMMYALSGQLITITSTIIGSSGMGGMDSGPGGMAISPDGGIAIEDFKFFAYLAVSTTAMFAAFIISTIKTGTIREGIRNIPTYVGFAFIMFLIGSWALNNMFAGIF